MKKGLALLALFVVVVSMNGRGVLVAQQPLPITRVLLYKNGMAYVVRSGQLTAPLRLTFHPEDMNDVLKSFTAWNPDTSTLYSVGYTAGIPSSHMLRRFPFSVAGPDTGIGGFLTQVKGADVRLTISNNGSIVEGKLMALQPVDRVVAPQTSSNDQRLTLLLRNGSLQTLWLSDVRSIEFVDQQLREQLKSYLEVLAEGRQDVTRDVTVYPVPATGPIRVAYLQQFPLWKTSYRLDMGDKESRVQGWAQIDNPTGESWNNVEVSLLSGAPVSFVMNLYDPLYTTRTTVGVPGAQVASPRQYEVTTGIDNVTSGLPTLPLGQRTTAQILAQLPGVAGGAVSALANRGLGSGIGSGSGSGMGTGVSASSPPVDVAGFQQAEATQVQDAFEYRFPFPVQLASRQSALLPFMQKTMNVERLSIFNARSDRGNPRLGAQLENNTGIPFEPGPVTFFESGRYAGEAVLAYLSRGEKRLVSYGVDYDVQIAVKSKSEPETTTRVTINRGTAVLFNETVMTTTYEIRSKNSQKTLVIEHPRMADRTLKGVTAWETTDGFYRFRQTLAPAQSITLPIAEVVSRQTRVALQSLNRDQLVMFAGNETPAQVREKLSEIVGVQEQLAAWQADVNTAETKIGGLFTDQERLRENLKALRDAREEQALRKRYLDQLTAQEEQLQELRTRVDGLKREIATGETRFSNLIANLSWEASAR